MGDYWSETKRISASPTALAASMGLTAVGVAQRTLRDHTPRISASHRRTRSDKLAEARRVADLRAVWHDTQWVTQHGAARWRATWVETLRQRGYATQWAATCADRYIDKYWAGPREPISSAMGRDFLFPQARWNDTIETELARQPATVTPFPGCTP